MEIVLNKRNIKNDGIGFSEIIEVLEPYIHCSNLEQCDDSVIHIHIIVAPCDSNPVMTFSAVVQRVAQTTGSVHAPQPTLSNC